MERACRMPRESIADNQDTTDLDKPIKWPDANHQGLIAVGKNDYLHLIACHLVMMIKQSIKQLVSTNSLSPS